MILSEISLRSLLFYKQFCFISKHSTPLQLVRVDESVTTNFGRRCWQLCLCYVWL